MAEKFLPGETFRITNEGVEASAEVLYKQALNAPELKFVPSLLKDAPNSKVVLVGGIVRDGILGLKSKDYDLLIEGINQNELDQILSLFGEVAQVQSRAYGVTKFKPRGINDLVDIAFPRTESYQPGERASSAEVDTEKRTVEDDLGRRDFTINAIGLNMGNGEVIDPFGGVNDIQEKVIRAVGDPNTRFLEDPSRILRGLRFACKYHFNIDPKTTKAMKQHKDEILKTFIDDRDREVTRVAPEKIGEEFVKTLIENPVATVELYDQIGLLKMLLQEVFELKNIEQPPKHHSEGDAFQHTLLALNCLPHHPSNELALATLFHDIGKRVRPKHQKIPIFQVTISTFLDTKVYLRRCLPTSPSAFIFQII